MKILELAPYIYVEDHPFAKRNQSGLSYMIRGIVEMLSVDNTVYVYTQSVLTAKTNIGKWTLLSKTILGLLFHCRIRYIKYYLCLSFVHKTFQEKLRLFFYFLSAGMAEYHVKKVKPDVIHVHGIGFRSLPFYIVASRFSIPIVSTLHGLNSWNELTNCSKEQKILERSFIENYVNCGCMLTFVSSGIKRKVEVFMKGDFKNLFVINNSIAPLRFHLSQNREKQRNIINLICIGTLSYLKNHIQVVRVLPQIQIALQNRYEVYLHIVGDGFMRKPLFDFVQANNINHVFFHGRVSHDKVIDILSNSDLLIFPSIEDGFGLPIIEAYQCGVPVVTFSDLDAVNDVYDPGCMVLANNRDNSTLIDAITLAINIDWDRNYIIRFSSQFSFQTIGVKYNHIMQTATVPINSKVIGSVIEQLNMIS